MSLVAATTVAWKNLSPVMARMIPMMNLQMALMEHMLSQMHQVQLLPLQVPLLVNRQPLSNLLEQNPNPHVANILLEHGKLIKPEHSYACSVCWDQ